MAGPRADVRKPKRSKSEDASTTEPLRPVALNSELMTQRFEF
jgi:hypothetical protein